MDKENKKLNIFKIICYSMMLIVSILLLIFYKFSIPAIIIVVFTALLTIGVELVFYVGNRNHRNKDEKE